MNFLHPIEELKKRPLIISFLCIFTIFGNCIIFISGLFSLLALNLVNYFSLLPMYNDLVSYVISGGTIYAIISILLSFFTIVAASQMWNLRKMGFYLYVICKITMIIVPFVFLVPSVFEFEVVATGIIPYIATTSIFTLLYGINLKHMH